MAEKAVISFLRYVYRPLIFHYIDQNRRRKKYEKVRQPDQIDLTAINKSKLISTTELKNYCVQHHANSDHGFQQEFEVSHKKPSVSIVRHTIT